ncbi:MAG: PQQ-binding-like beta-propeller repeat protein [Candidatus Altiarchaeota archaeon]
MRKHLFLFMVLALTAVADSAAPPVMWEFKARGTIQTDLVLEGDVIYFGTSSGMLYGVNKTTGSEVINYTSTAGIYSTPLVTGGLVIFGCDNKIVYAINKTTGSRVWTFLAKDKVRGPPILHEGVVFIGSDDKHLYGLKESTGKMVWSHKTGYPVQSKPVVEEWKIYYASGDRKAYSLSRITGEVLWNTSLKGGVTTNPATLDDVIYYTASDRRLYALDKYSGEVMWNYSLNNTVYGSPIESNDNIIVVDREGYVYSIDALSGNNIWTLRLGDRTYADPAIYDGMIYVGSGNSIHALNEYSGIVHWSRNLSTSIRKTPAYSEGILYVPAGYYVDAIGGVADVRVDDLRTDPMIPVDGRVLNAVVELTNTGDAIASGVNVTVYLDRNEESGRVVDILPGRSRSLEFRFNATYGRHLLEVIADRENKVIESDEDNNRRGVVFSVMGEWPTFKRDNRRGGSYSHEENYSRRVDRVSWSCMLNSSSRSMRDADFMLDLVNRTGDYEGFMAAEVNYTCYFYNSRGYPIDKQYSVWECGVSNVSREAYGNFTLIRDYLNTFNETAYNKSVMQGRVEYPFNFTEYTVTYSCRVGANSELPVEDVFHEWSCRPKAGFEATPYDLAEAWYCSTRHYSNYSIEELAELRGYPTQSKMIEPVRRIRIRDYEILWSFKTGGGIKTTPVAADLDGDGNLEVVVGSSDGIVYALGPRGDVLWEYSVKSPIYSTPTVMDVNGDNNPEVLFGSDNGRIYVLNSSGSLLWSYKTEGMVRSSPLVANLDALPSPEVVFGSMDEKIYCLDSNGNLLWDYSTSEAVLSSPAIVDIDSDRMKEVMIGSNDNIVYTLKTPPYKVWSYQASDDITQTAAVDEGNSIYVPSGRIMSKIYYSKYTDEEGIPVSRLLRRWIFNGTHDITTSVSLGRIDNDSVHDIVFGAGNELIVVNDSGDRIMRYSLSRPIRSTPALADVDGDNVTDIVFGSNEGVVYVLDYPGIIRWSYDLNSSIASSPAVADLTGDGTLEIIIGDDEGRLFVFGSWFELKRMNALRAFRNAERRFDSRKIVEAEDLAVLARQRFTALGDDEGVRDCNNLLHKIRGYNIYLKASEEYDAGEYGNALSHADDAVMIFSLIRDGFLLAEVKDLRGRIVADESMAAAEDLFGLEDCERACVSAKNAYNSYRMVSDLDGADSVDMLVKNSRMVCGDTCVLTE